MQNTDEVYFVVIVGITLALLLVGFIVTILFLYQRRQHRQEQELARMRDEYQNELLQSQLEIKEATFKTIAQELHDNISQMLSVVKFSLATLSLKKDHPDYESIYESREMLNKAIFDLSDITKSMHTDRITKIGLVEAIKFELQMLQKMKLFETSLDSPEEHFHFDEQKEIFLFRMFQEIMNNIIKHAKAKLVEVKIENPDGHKFKLVIRDDGVGFNVTEKQLTTSSSAGVGLKSIINRAKLIGASVKIDSAIGRGSSFTVELSLQKSLHQV
jgi:two-component system, NarL family, sensor kinase